MYKLSVEQHRFFGINGFLRVEGLIGDEDLKTLDRHSMALAKNEVDLRRLPVEISSGIVSWIALACTKPLWNWQPIVTAGPPRIC